MRTLPLIISLCLYASTLPAQAGELDNLEKEATQSPSKSKKRSSKGKSKNSYNSDPSLVDEVKREISVSIAKFIVESSVKLIGYSALAVVAGGSGSHARYMQSEPELIDIDELTDNNEQVSGNKNNPEAKQFKNSFYRADGDPILPMLRLSSHWLYSTSDINAKLNRVEVGYSFLGISHTQNILNEDGDQLKLSNTLIHYRMSLANDLSWDLAYGRGKMNGNQNHDGSVFAMPIRFRFNPEWHFEYYPVWSSYKGGSLAEHQFSFNYHYKYVGATVGYKTWSAGTTSIDGFFTGVYLSF